ncbi:1-phosphatidylinositol 4:5-bisphosphate phosphodiesterase classes I and II-like protein [Dinothrombium tinctorium]|uniref:1-phosphatidylinositol 4:5-bisphosphate phosphodiesterase classes I and II-like protein n=1 Tax=Dinothrombium tinctorium TaxID=1965070 RepID=A0A443RKE5_9ACAR|nr:1-phosphatidylinositol 4:5-bisphosphate phosphodiesterase classes I and II-like protein [Dinothrombium tinctorium]
MKDSTVGTPVTLRVDPNGFFIYWTDQNKETEHLEISSIRDVRTGKNAKTPKEGKLRDSVNCGPSDIALEDKTLTIVHGSDFTNEWLDSLMKMAYNLLALNSSANTFLQKAYTKILLLADREGKIPVRR